MSNEAWAERLHQLSTAFPHVEQGDLFKLENFCLADANRDDQVTAEDVAAFTDLWARGDEVTGYLADLNRDGVLDQQDLDQFLDAYFKNDCDAKALADVRSYMC